MELPILIPIPHARDAVEAVVAAVDRQRIQLRLRRKRRLRQHQMHSLTLNANHLRKRHRTEMHRVRREDRGEATRGEEEGQARVVGHAVAIRLHFPLDGPLEED